MYPQIFKKAILPTLDRFNQTRIASVLNFLEESQWWPEQKLRDLQESKLNKLLDLTKAESSFYQEYWKEAPEERRIPSLYPELDGLPVISKEDLRPRLDQFPVHAFQGRALKYNTSGSTGAPMTFYRSAEQESWFWAIRMRMWQWAGFELGEPYLAINLNPRTAWKKRVQDLFFRCTYLTYNTDNQNSQLIVDRLQSSGSVHINGFSSSIYALARYMKQNGIANPGVKAITATGDDLYPEHRRLIEEVFGVKVTDYYGAGGEGMHLASQCEEAGRYHLHSENSIVELIHDGRPARPGELARIVVTQLDNCAMPLIRYDLGDLATVASEEPCPCGRAFPVIQAVNGRACDLIYAPNGAALLPQFFFIGAFKMLKNVHRYQLVQKEVEKVTVKLVAQPGCNREECEESIRDEIARATEGSLSVEFEWVNEIPLSGRGKPRPVISKLSAPPTAFAPDSLSRSV